MKPSIWSRLQAVETPISRYQQKFTEHEIPPGVLKLAADTGMVPRLKAAAQQALESGQPIRDWSAFIPSYARTSESAALVEQSGSGVIAGSNVG